MPVKTTFLEVSRAAGVSQATVSRVAAGNARVDPEIARRVRRSAAELGVDLARRERARTIVLVLSNRDVGHPVHSRVLQGAQKYCLSREWEPAIVPFASPEASGRAIRLPQLLQVRSVVRAAVLVGATSPALMAALKTANLPFAVQGNNVLGDWRPDGCDCVFFDGVQGALEITSMLIRLGHKHIWHISNCELPWFAQSAEGYRRAMAEAGLEPRVADLHTGEREMGYLCAKSILARGERVTAIFGGSDMIAQGIYQALTEAGRRIPDDISVAGFNDTEGAILNPALTTARFFSEEMGAHLAEFVINRADKPDLPWQQLTIPMKIVRRDSCAALTRP